MTHDVVQSETINLISDVQRMLGRLGVPVEEAQKRISDAIMGVLAGALRPDPRTVWPIEPVPTSTESRGSGIRVSQIAPMSLATPPSGATFRGTGKKAVGVNGEAVEIGTWVNPGGEDEAARLTKKTGVIHYVDPKDGQVKSLGELPTDMLSSAAMQAPASGTLASLPVGGEAQAGAYESLRK